MYQKAITPEGDKPQYIKDAINKGKHDFVYNKHELGNGLHYQPGIEGKSLYTERCTVKIISSQYGSNRKKTKTIRKVKLPQGMIIDIYESLNPEDGCHMIKVYKSEIHKK